MTLQKSMVALIAEGYKIVAEYKKFEHVVISNDLDYWKVDIATCLQKGNECVIKLSDNRRKSTYTLYYSDKSSANAKIKQLIDMGYKKARKRKG